MTIACADRGVRWAALVEPPELSEWYLVPLIECLIKQDVIYLRREGAGRTPPLYRSGVRYRSEGPKQEHWRTIPWVLSLGAADCKSLAAWRCAELWVSGEKTARCSMSVRASAEGFKLFHVFVRRSRFARDPLPYGFFRAHGYIYEDPSRILGMP